MIVQLNDIHFSYPGASEKPVLSLDHWSVSEQETVFLQGPSGCGKSTLLNILSGILLPDEGEVVVLEESIHKMSSHKRDAFRANNLGYVFQQFNLIPYLNAIENIRLANYFSNSRVTSDIIKQDIKSLLNSLNIDVSDWYKPAAQLSIGQQQRIAIARALINKPSLLIVDEPTSSLDRDNRDAFMSVLLSHVKEYQLTLIFVSHDISLADSFSRVDSLPKLNLSLD